MMRAADRMSKEGTFFVSGIERSSLFALSIRCLLFPGPCSSNSAAPSNYPRLSAKETARCFIVRNRRNRKPFATFISEA